MNSDIILQSSWVLYWPTYNIFVHNFRFLGFGCLCDRKRTLDPIVDGCEPLCGCWELNAGPLKEQPLLLTFEPTLQPPIIYYNTYFHLWYEFILWEGIVLSDIFSPRGRHSFNEPKQDVGQYMKDSKYTKWADKWSSALTWRLLKSLST